MTDPNACTVQRHLDAADESAQALFHRFEQLVDAIGPVRWTVSKTAIVAKGSRRGFTGVVLKRAALAGYFDLQRTLPEMGRDSRLRSASAYTARLFVHQFRVTAIEQFDATFVGWLTEAFEVGNGAHLPRPQE